MWTAPKDLNWNRTAMVLVTGDMPNTCGHVLLYVGGGFGHYFQYNGPNPFGSLPEFLNGDSVYRTYLTRGRGKTELARKYLAIPKPGQAQARLEELMNTKWRTLLIRHNCVTFAQEIIKAGGNFWDFATECPVLGMGSQLFWEKLFGHDTAKVVYGR